MTEESEARELAKEVAEILVGRGMWDRLYAKSEREFRNNPAAQKELADLLRMQIESGGVVPASSDG